LLDAADNIVKNIKKRCLVFFVCNNCFESLAGYLGFMRANIVPVLIRETINKTFLNNLLKTYKPKYIFLPNFLSQSFSNFTIIYSIGTYTLIKTNYNIDYNIHNDLALLLTTSGSTGSPKLVRQSYKNIYSNAQSITEYLGITSTDRAITTMPMSYSYGLSIINTHLQNGASIILTDLSVIKRSFWNQLRNYKATTFGGVPYIYEILKKLHFSQMNLPSLKYITQAGGKLGMKLSQEFTDICTDKGIQFYAMYGQTEATARMAYLPWEYARTKVGSIGIEIPGGKFWLEDKNRNIINNNEMIGELVYKGDNVMMGYAQSYFDLHNGNENNGILYTGDLAKRDKDGFYFVIGRKKRFLKMYGNRVSLDEIEELITEGGYEGVCGGSDDNLKVYITNPDDKEQIVNYISKFTGINRAGFSFVFIDKIPRNNSGKVQYSVLSEDEKNYC